MHNRAYEHDAKYLRPRTDLPIFINVARHPIRLHFQQLLDKLNFLGAQAFVNSINDLL